MNKSILKKKISSGRFNLLNRIVERYLGNGDNGDFEAFFGVKYASGRLHLKAIGKFTKILKEIKTGKNQIQVVSLLSTRVRRIMSRLTQSEQVKSKRVAPKGVVDRIVPSIVQKLDKALREILKSKIAKDMLFVMLSKTAKHPSTWNQTLGGSSVISKAMGFGSAANSSKLGLVVRIPKDHMVF